MSALWIGEDDPIRDHTYRKTPIGREIVAWLAWLDIGGLKPKTLEDYERNAAYLALAYPTLRLEQVTDAELVAVISAWPKPGQRVRAAALKSLFRWAVRTRRIDRNPVDMLPEMRSGKRRKHIDVFTDAEIGDLYDLPMVDSILMHLLFEAGVRKGEAISLQVRRLKLGATPRVVVVDGKGGEDRDVTMSRVLQDAVRDFLMFEQLAPQDYLWYTRPGGGRKLERSRPMSAASFGWWWQRCLEQAGVRYRNPHTARHTFATRYLRRGGRLLPLAEEMGHADPATTLHYYGHLDKRDVLADYALIDAAENSQDFDA